MLCGHDLVSFQETEVGGVVPNLILLFGFSRENNTMLVRLVPEQDGVILF
jgi:hypothetical protein